MIDLYLWLFSAQRNIINQAEILTGTRPKESFINISDLPGRFGQFEPEGGTIQGDKMNIITLDRRLFEMGSSFVLQVLSHEILHSIEMVEDHILEEHGIKFKALESKLNIWVDKYSDTMPDTNFKNMHLWKFKAGVSKIITYSCPCGVEINHKEYLDIKCMKCGHSFYITNDGCLEFNDELIERSKLLKHTANRLKLATDRQIYRYRILGLDKQLKQICTPKKFVEVAKGCIDNATVKNEMELLHKRVLNVRALEGAKVSDTQLQRIAYILSG